MVKLVIDLHHGSLKVVELVIELQYEGPRVMTLVWRPRNMDSYIQVS